MGGSVTTPQPGYRLFTDGQWRPEYGPAASPKKHTARNALLILGAVILLMFVACAVTVGGAVNEAVDKVNKPDVPGSISQGLGANDATADVVLGAAYVPHGHTTYLPVTVTNHSAKRSNYYITVAADGADGSRIDTGTVYVLNLEAGQATVSEKATFLEELPADVKFSLLEVQRMAS